MCNQNSQITANNYLYFLDEAVSLFMARNPLQGEEWASTYKNHPKQFRILTKAEVFATKKLREFFKNYAAYSQDFIDWSQLPTLADLVVRDDAPVWESWKTALFAIYFEVMSPIVEAGGQHQQEESNYDFGFTSSGHPAINFLRRQGAELVKGVTLTTKKNIRAAIRTSLDLGEDRAGMVSRVTGVIDNPVRAELISQTESVRAYVGGQLEVARELPYGVEKVWESIVDGRTSDICLDLDGKKVEGVDTLFTSIYLGDPIYGPPAHPRCRSGLHIRKKS